MLLVKQSASKVVPFFMVDSANHISPKTGLSPSVQISKAGGTFATAGGTVAEIGSGWYKITLSSTDTDTLGALAFHITASGADSVDFTIQIVAFDPESSTNLGLSRIDADISSRATDASVWGYSSRTLTSFGTLVSDIWNYSTRTLTAFSTSLAVAVWDVLESAIGTSGSIGVKVKTNLDATVSSRSTLTDSQVWSYTSRTLTSFGSLVSDIWNYSTRTLTAFSTSLAVAVWDVLESAITTADSIGLKVKNNLDATVSSRSTLTAGQAADAVWDEPLADHQTSGSAGAALSAAGNAGDPWATQLPGSYGSGTAGYILGNRLDVAVSTRSTLTASQAADAVWDEPIADHLTSGSTGAALNAAGSAGDPWATQLPGSYGSGTAGYIVGNRLDTTVSSRAPASTALSNATWTDARAAKLDNLDTTVSSRAPASTALSNATWTDARAAKLDNLDATVSSRAPASTALSNTTWTDARAAKLDNLDAAVSSRAPAATALSNATWTDARAAKLDNLDATVSSRSTLTASDVWGYTTRTLTSFGTLVSDIWGYTTGVGTSAVSLLERSYRTLINKMKVNKSTGSVTLYTDNDTGTAATGTVTETDTEVTRDRLTWL